MGYIEKHLLDGEIVQYVTRLHWKVFIIPVALVLIFAVPLMGAVSNIFIILMCIGIILVPYYKRKLSEFGVTNKRVIIKIGIIRTKSFELLL